MIDLGTLSEFLRTAGYDINNKGQVVGAGTAYQFGGLPFLYSEGVMYNLNDLIDPALNLTLQQAVSINDNGQILANTVPDRSNPTRQPRAYLLTPIPEPSTLALFGVALLTLGAWVRGHKAHS